MGRFIDYKNLFQTVSFRREDEILETRLHRDGGPASWAEVSSGPDNRMVIFAGTGDDWMAGIDMSRPIKEAITKEHGYGLALEAISALDLIQRSK